MTIGDVEVFYRESGPSDAPVILLLHGFPTAGHMFRDLIPLLATNYQVIAPDLPGFGNTKAPRGEFAYTFDNLAAVIDRFIEALGLRRYALYIFDYGAPTGCRIALAHPERDFYHQPKRQCLSRWVQRRLGTLADLLARTDTGAPRGLPRGPFA
jgi:pimeloyl-ACP methyl ester carboxylesterase